MLYRLERDGREPLEFRGELIGERLFTFDKGGRPPPDHAVEYGYSSRSDHVAAYDYTKWNDCSQFLPIQYFLYKTDKGDYVLQLKRVTSHAYLNNFTDYATHAKDKMVLFKQLSNDFVKRTRGWTEIRDWVRDLLGEDDIVQRI